MGVTIHCQGKLRDAAGYDSLIQIAQQHAISKEWLTEPIANTEVKLLRVDDNEQGWDYVGPTKGIAIYPHEDCEPIRLEFDRDLYIQEYAKTQFAGATIHVRVVQLLRKLEPYFNRLVVEDEGEYWNLEDEGVLVDHIRTVDRVIDEYRQKDPRTEVKIKTPSGRILDLVNYDQEQSGS